MAQSSAPAALNAQNQALALSSTEADDVDPFDAVLDLESQYFSEGYAAGAADGERAGLVEGRVFGLEKGFEKGMAMGLLNGRAAGWHARILKAKEESTTSESSADGDPKALKGDRLERHVRVLYELSEISSCDFRNEENAVEEFEERLKRAGAKAKVIEKIVGEGRDEEKGTGRGDGSTSENSEKSSLRLKRGNQGLDRNIEDFGIK